ALGLHLPENFDAPYLKPDLPRFWQSWHATLSSWMRDYVFFPLGRLLRARAPGLPRGAAILLCNLCTMVLIGLWHGLEGRFVLFGVWHGVGLFLWKKWADRRGPAPAGGSRLGTLVTLHFVMVGWTFFYARDVSECLAVLRRLAG